MVYPTNLMPALFPDRPQIATSRNPLSTMAVISAPPAASGVRAVPTHAIAVRVSLGALAKSGAALLNRWW